MTPPIPPELTGLEALGLTITAGMLFFAGALGAWCRAVMSGTQATWSQRTVVDLLIGGCVGLLLPIFHPIIDRMLGIDFKSWLPIQQAVAALMLGGSGSYFWTAIGWRVGLIVTQKQATTGEKPPVPPATGVLRGTNEARALQEGAKSEPPKALEPPKAAEPEKKEIDAP